MKTARFRNAILLVTASALSGCAWLETRPGHPDSYANTRYYPYPYKPHGLWAGTVAAGDPSAATAAGSRVFAIAKTPAEIWHARGYAHDAAIRYQAAAYKAQDRQDELAIPVFGAAIGVAATAIARVSTVGIAATGLGGAAAGAGYSYLHPDKDAAADQAAEAALFCVLDKSKILLDMSAVPLTLDKAALQDAVLDLETKSSALLNSTNPNDAAAKKAVQAVIDSGNQTIQALSAAISQYALLPGEIYTQVDTIDQATKSENGRSVDYQSLVSSLQTSASNQLQTDAAKAQLQAATNTVAQAQQTSSGSGGKAAAALGASASPAPAPTLMAAAQQVGAGARAGAATIPPAAAAAPSQPGEAAPGAPVIDNGTAKTAELQSVFDAAALSAVTRVTTLAQIATNDIPSPNFSDVAANIKACSLPK